MEQEDEDINLPNITIKTEPVDIIDESTIASDRYPGDEQNPGPFDANKLNTAWPNDPNSVSHVEVKLELNEYGMSIPFCPFTWRKTSANQSNNDNEYHTQELVTSNQPENIIVYSDVEIKQELVDPNMGISSEMDDVLPITDKHTLNQDGLYQAPVSCSQPINETPLDTTVGEISPTCSNCPGMKFVSNTHLLAHKIDKHGFVVPGDLKNTAEKDFPSLDLSTNKLATEQYAHGDFTSRSKCELFQCTMCEYECSRKKTLQAHVRRLHNLQKPFQCTICNSEYRQKGHLNAHMRIHTGEKPYHCTTCNSKFRQKNHLDAHIRKHTGEKPFQCTICNSKYRQRCSLDVHLRKHTGEKPFQCTICNSKYNQKCSLDDHIRTHTGEKPFQCTICNSEFRYRNSLHIHMRKHTGEKPFQCNICYSKFSQKSTADSHMRIHTGEKPFHCTICNSKFRHRRSFDMHMRIHTGEKPFRCTFCNSKYSQKCSLDEHMRIHTGEKPFQCTVCNSKFRQRSTLGTHMRIHT